MNIDTKDADMGLYMKYNVFRVDGRDDVGDKHWRCHLFVLDLNHDPHARVAILAYIESCKDEFPALAIDLQRTVDYLEVEG